MMGLLTPPAVPANLTGNSSGSAITLTWTPSAAAGSYNIQAISSGGVSSNILANSTSVTFTSLSPGTDYFFTVMTSDAGSGATILGAGPARRQPWFGGFYPSRSRSRRIPFPF